MGTLNANLNYLGQELSGELKGSYQGSGVNAKMTNVHRNALPVGLDSNARKILESVSGSHWRSYDLNGSSPTGNKLIRAVRRFSDDVSALVVA